MKKLTKLKTTLKPIITAFSTLALCYSTLSYAGDNSAIDLINLLNQSQSMHVE